MKTSLSRHRKSAAITNSRWLAYATEGAASAFTSAPSAEGAIHYSGQINKKFKCYESAEFPLDRLGDAILLPIVMDWLQAGTPPLSVAHSLSE